MRAATNMKVLALAIAAVMAGCSSNPKNTEEANIEETPVTEATTAVSDSDASTFGDSTSGQANVEDAARRAQEEAEARLRGTTVFYFDYDQAIVKTAAYEALKAHARFLANNAAASVRLEGHADERGTREYNIALGERRANAISKFLLVNGASRNQIDVVSYGEEKAAAFGHSESSWALNRRTELKYVSN